MAELAITGRDASTINNSHLKPPMNARPTNVESAIPRTPQRDPNNFPYEYREYPKAMNVVADKAYVDAWHERNRQTGDDGKSYWPGGRPIAGKTVVPLLDELGQPVFVYDEDEEREFRTDHPETMSIVSTQQKLESLEGENARMRDELERLRRAVAGQPDQGEPDKAAPVETKPVENALGGLTKQSEPDRQPAPKGKVELPPRLK